MILATMIFLHIINDFNLQGWLAAAKQKEWWQDNAPQSLYKFDYICALLIHSFSWAFMIMIPIMFSLNFELTIMAWYFLGANTMIHMWIDNAKANRKSINLITDQILHLIQIVATFIWCCIVN